MTIREILVCINIQYILSIRETFLIQFIDLVFFSINIISKQYFKNTLKY